MAQTDTVWLRGEQVLVTLDQVQGRRGAGVHLLTIHLEVEGRQDLVGNALAFSGQLSVGFSPHGMVYVGQLHSSATPPLFMPLQTGEVLNRRVELSVDVSPQQLEAIEDARKGGEVELLLDVNGLLVGASPAESFSGQLRYRLDVGMWTRLLEQMGFAKSIIVTIPLDGPGSKRVRLAAERLERALGDVASGRYREAVRECRDLVEALYSDDDEIFKGFKPTFPNQREAGKAARIYFIRQAIFVLTHAAAHDDEVARTFQWERRDAQAVVGLLASMLQQEA